MIKIGKEVFGTALTFIYKGFFIIIVPLIFIGCSSPKPTLVKEHYTFNKETVGIPPWKSKYQRIHQPEDPDWRWDFPWDHESVNKDNIEFTDSCVRIWARNGKHGCLYSNFHFKYGIVTAKIRLPKENGAWSAFWIFGESGMPENDVFEHCGGENYVNVTHHWGYSYNEGGRYKKHTLKNKRRNLNPHEWNIYQVEVTPFKTKYRINGKTVRTMWNGTASDKRHILLTCGWGDYCGGNTPDAFMEVEWLTVEKY